MLSNPIECHFCGEKMKCIGHYIKGNTIYSCFRCPECNMDHREQSQLEAKPLNNIREKVKT